MKKAMALLRSATITAAAAACCRTANGAAFGGSSFAATATATATAVRRHCFITASSAPGSQPPPTAARLVRHPLPGSVGGFSGWGGRDGTAIPAASAMAPCMATRMATRTAAWCRAAAFTTTSTALSMVQSRGLEKPEEGATPLPGGMTLYVKAGPDGQTVGDCPFAHYVRIVLTEKGLPYDLKPCTADTKPQWLIDFYDGSMPALRHRKECYTESDVIAQYLDFFFPSPPLSDKKALTARARSATEGLFPSIAKYLKHTPDGDDDDVALRDNLFESLQKLEHHLTTDQSDDPDNAAAAGGGGGRAGPYFVGTGELFTLIDASLAPKLYHMEVGLDEFKNKSNDSNDDDANANATIDVASNFPALRSYMDAVFARPSFVETLDYPRETVVWGWTNARRGEGDG